MRRVVLPGIYRAGGVTNGPGLVSTGGVRDPVLVNGRGDERAGDDGAATGAWSTARYVVGRPGGARRAGSPPPGPRTPPPRRRTWPASSRCWAARARPARP